jgi:hypothetical protein
MTRKKKRGRPAWKPTKVVRAKARTLLAMGTSVPDVAAILRVDAKTLRKHLRAEIRTARAEADAMVLAALYRAATDRERPNIRAARTWAELRNLFPSTARAVESSKPGKKAKQHVAAQKVASSGRFAPGAPPRLATLNGEPVQPAGTDDEPAK